MPKIFFVLFLLFYFYVLFHFIVFFPPNKNGSLRYINPIKVQWDTITSTTRTTANKIAENGTTGVHNGSSTAQIEKVTGSILLSVRFFALFYQNNNTTRKIFATRFATLTTRSMKLFSPRRQNNNNNAILSTTSESKSA